MQGTQKVQIQNKRVRYEFELKRNLTVLRGDSATGKTTLIDMIEEHSNNGNDSAIQFICDRPCYVLSGTTWKGQLSEMHVSIVFIDEGNAFVVTDEFSNVIQKTDNYYVIVSREGLPNLPYSVTEIYGIRTTGKYGGLKQYYHEFYRIYGSQPIRERIYPQVIVTEDSHAGFQFFLDACTKNGILCVSSDGKSNMLREATKQEKDICVLLIADGAAFGSEMDRVMKFLSGHPDIKLYVPESFEWLILSANPMKDPDVQNTLADPGAHIESRQYFSWERFFTRLLTDRTHGTWLQYTKGQINPAYLQGEVQKAILEQMKPIVFDKPVET